MAVFLQARKKRRTYFLADVRQPKMRMGFSADVPSQIVNSPDGCLKDRSFGQEEMGNKSLMAIESDIVHIYIIDHIMGVHAGTPNYQLVWFSRNIQTYIF